jgi:hypothetical protein
MASVPQSAGTTVPPPATQIGNDPAANYQALRNQREVLGNQRQNLEQRRDEMRQEWEQMSSSNPAKDGLGKRIQGVDARLVDLEGQLAKSDAAVAQAAGVPGAITQEPPPPPRTDPDPELIVGLTFVVAMVFAVPMSIAYARRVWRRSAKTEVTLPPQMIERMESMERGMEAVALEVERIGESQRFLTQTMTERLDARALGAGAAQPIPVKAGERVEQRR